MLVWARFVATRMERVLDEVQLAGRRFAKTRGAVVGTFVTVLVLLPTPVVDWVTDNLILMTTSGETPERDTVYVGMVFGMVLLIVVPAARLPHRRRARAEDRGRVPQGERP